MADRTPGPPSRLRHAHRKGSKMNSQMLPGRGTEAAERAEDRFFDALAAGDVARIEDLLHEDFLIVDVMSGGVADRASFLAALRDRLVAVDRVPLLERAGPPPGGRAGLVRP